MRTIISGVKLPREFDGASIINNIAITPDGKKYAVVSESGGVEINDMPSNGILEIGGTTVHYGGYAGRVSIGSHIRTGGSVIISGVSISNGSVSFNGSDLEVEVDKGYEGVRRLEVRGVSNDVRLGLSDDGKVYVKGKTNAEPSYKDGRLSVERLNGDISAPKSDLELDLDIETTAGDITGDVAHKGYLRTTAGDISITLLTPVAVSAGTSCGKISVEGMLSKGHGRYVPPNVQSWGSLTLRTTAGDITVRYKGQ